MKKCLVAAILAVTLCVASGSARAQVFGQYRPADVLAVNGHEFGAYLDFTKNTLGLLGQLRLSFYPGVDFGFQGGLSRLNYVGGDRTILRLGTDFKVAVAHASDQFPVDLAIGAGIGVETGDKYSLLTLEPSAVASRKFGMSPSASIVPYAAASFAFQNVNVSSNNQTDFSLPLRLGAELRAIPGVNIVAELQFNLGDSFNDDVGFGAGVNFPF